MKMDMAVEKFAPGQVRSGSRIMDYLLFTPKTEANVRYPMVIYLHGAGERGSDLQMVLANSGARTFASEEWQKKHPCFVLAPQVSGDEWWTDDLYMELVAKAASSLPGRLPVDPDRIYITGLSMGGMGVWRAISRYPDLFAAAMPICGAGDPFEVRAAKKVPVWAFHAEDDTTVRSHGYLTGDKRNGFVGTRDLVTSLRGAGNQEVRYTEYPAGWMKEHGFSPHASWNPAYEDAEAKEWLFSHVRTDRYEIHWVMPGFYWIDDAKGASIYLIEGGARALVVDTGWCDADFTGMIRSLTRLPFDLAVTHCHHDHMYHLDQFDRFYMSEKDRFLLESDSLKESCGGKDYSRKELMPVKDGDLIDLGGGYEIEVFALGGHTPGSVVYLDKKRKIALIGDVLGCWMQVPGAADLATYQAELSHFLGRISAPEYEGVVFMGGHRKQEGGYYLYDRYVPNDLQKVRDMIALCGMVQEGEIAYRPYSYSFDEQAYIAKYGQASLMFTLSQIKKNPAP